MHFDHIVIFVHVLAWVCWLGMDLGVFIGSRMTENPKLSVETRMTILKLTLTIDKAPRLSVPVIFATGVFLSNRYGVDVISPALGAVLGVIWFGIVWTAVNNPPGSKASVIATKTNLGVYAIVVLGMGGVALSSLFGVSDVLPGWLAVKWAAFAWIALFAIGIDLTVKPVIRNYLRLQNEGSTDEINKALSDSLKPLYAAVFAVYGGTIVAAYFGIIKPF